MEERKAHEQAVAAQDVFQRMQHNTLKIQDCTGTKCTTEIVRVHDTAVLDSARQLGHTDALQPSDNATDRQHNSIHIDKQPGKPLTVTVRQDESSAGQQVSSGGTVLTDEAQSNLGKNESAVQQKLVSADPVVAQRAAQIAGELSSHSAAKHHEGDNVLEVHRSNLTNVAAA